MNTAIKTCFKCRKEKPLAEFYKHKAMGDGHLNKCKSCTKRDVKSQNKSYCNIVWGDGKGVKAWQKRNPKKRSAHVAVSNAVRDGKLIKQPCEVCGELKVQGHHDDYTKPLDVRWLCVSHHAEHHAR